MNLTLIGIVRSHPMRARRRNHCAETISAVVGRYGSSERRMRTFKAALCSRMPVSGELVPAAWGRDDDSPEVV